MHTFHLSHCFIPQIDATPVLNFTRLKQIQLKNVYILEVAIEHLLTRCIVLEDLWLQGIHRLTTICIVSWNLHTLAVSDMSRNECCILEFWELVIVDAPCLEPLIVHGDVYPTLVTVMSAPKLAVLGYLPANSSELFSGSINAQVEQSSSSSFFFLIPAL
jgi:hypothetical protein